MRRLRARWIVVGAALMFFFDPQQGRRRRALAKDRTGALVRRFWRRSGRAGRTVSATAYGVAQKATHVREQEKDLDDVTLARKVESEIFREADAPKGQVDVNAVDGVVYLRGEVESEEMTRDLERATRNVSGVKGVENLLHTPGTRAPTTPPPSAG
jgi:osmotically-inducible protein OsmY